MKVITQLIVCGCRSPEITYYRREPAWAMSPDDHRKEEDQSPFRRKTDRAGLVEYGCDVCKTLIYVRRV